MILPPPAAGSETRSSLSFVKMEGLGNDFLVVDLRRGPAPAWLDQPEVIRKLCDRRRGVGADGVLAVLPARPGLDAAARMRVLNADGSEAQMCGNGLRCVAKYLFESAVAPGTETVLAIDTAAGVLHCQLHPDPAAPPSPDEEWDIEVAMGAPRLQRGLVPMLGPESALCIDEPLTVDGETVRITAVSMGNPHAVIFVPPGVRGAELRALAQRLGPRLEHHPLFPERVNVELCHRRASDDYELVVWERGCGLTSACGTGACAVAVAACRLGLAETDRWLKIELPGGPLQLRVLRGERNVHMRGPARTAFRGQVVLGAEATGPGLVAEAARGG